MDEDGLLCIAIKADHQDFTRYHLDRVIRHQVSFPICNQVDLAGGDDLPVCLNKLRLAYHQADLAIGTCRDILGNCKKILNLLQGKQVDPAFAAEKNDRSSVIRYEADFINCYIDL